MRKVLFALIFLVLMATVAPTAFGQKMVKRCYYTSATVRRVVPKGCNSCNRLLLVEQRLAVLEAKKPAEVTPVDLSEVTRLRKEFDELLPRVEKLEQQMIAVQGDITQLRNETGELRTDLNTQTGRIDLLEPRVGKLESQCYAISKRVGKKFKAFDSCTGEELKQDGSGKWVKALKIANEVGQWACILFDCRIINRGGGGGRPPIVTTLP